MSLQAMKTEKQVQFHLLEVREVNAMQTAIQGLAQQARQLSGDLKSAS